MDTPQHALDALMQAHGTRLLRLCAVILQDEHLAQDAVQDTFLRAYRHWERFRHDADALTWLTAIAVNVCRDYRRSAWFRHVDSRRDLAALPEPSADFPETDRTVLREVKRLAPKYREAVVLRYYQQMKVRDVAAALHLSERAVRQRLNRANAVLRERLKEWYEDE